MEQLARTDDPACLARLLASGFWRHLALGGASLLCALAAASDAGHDEAAMVAIFLASLVSGIAGFAFSAICGAMLFHLSGDPIRVVQIMITCSIANQAAMTWAARRHIEWRSLRIFLAGGALGLMLGVWILLHADRTIYSRALGIFLASYGAYMLVRNPMIARRPHAAIDFGSGFLGGITGGAGGFPSASVSIWCSIQGWNKARQRAMVQPFVLVMQVGAFLVISLARQSETVAFNYDVSDMLFIPALLLGTSLGVALYKRLSDGQFARAVNVLLIVAGISYIF